MGCANLFPGPAKRRCAGRSRVLLGALLTVTAALAMAGAPAARTTGDEAKTVIARLLAPPHIKAAAGFTARIAVPPGELYDPLFMVPHQGAVWLNDDGGMQDGNGGRIVSISMQGKVTVLIGPEKLLPTVGMDIAPAGFGSFGGQIVTLAQPIVGEKGIAANHVIQIIDLKTHSTKILCTLPPSGDINHGIAGGGADAKFGPPGSPFAGKFFAVTTVNDAIYQVSGDGKCAPFVNFGSLGAPVAFTFTPDGSAMLVSVNPVNTKAGEHRGIVVSVSPQGQADPKPVVTGLASAGGLGFAPKGFGGFAGQLFITDFGDFQLPVPMTQALHPDGGVYRVAPGGKLALVASGFVNPLGLRFIGNRLWVTDIVGDFIDGRRELPDGFVVEIGAETAPS
jgi:hypothetical protein